MLILRLSHEYAECECVTESCSRHHISLTLNLSSSCSQMSLLSEVSDSRLSELPFAKSFPRVTETTPTHHQQQGHSHAPACHLPSAIICGSMTFQPARIQDRFSSPRSACLGVFSQTLWLRNFASVTITTGPSAQGFLSSPVSLATQAELTPSANTSLCPGRSHPPVALPSQLEPPLLAGRCCNSVGLSSKNPHGRLDLWRWTGRHPTHFFTKSSEIV